jgi:hypothetical protein
MLAITIGEFRRLLALRSARQRQTQQVHHRAVQGREKVLRPDQVIERQMVHGKEMSTCPNCDALVDVKILHPHSGLCPLCHEEWLINH